MMRAMARLDGAHLVNFDFCGLGMKAKSDDGAEKLVKKRTKVMTNSGHIATSLAKAQCSQDHQHVRLEGGKASACEVYPNAFCELVVKGLQRELEDYKWLRKVKDQIMEQGMMGELVKLVETVEQLEVPPDDEAAQLEIAVYEMQVELWQGARIGRIEGVVEDRPNAVQGVLLSVTCNGPPALEAVAAHVVEAVQVIGVAMGKQHGVDHANVTAQSLGPQIGRRIH